MDVNDITPEPLPEEAAAALINSGAQLLRQLEEMRTDESAEIDLEPLDSRAMLALRRHGDVLLDRLEMQRPSQPAVGTSKVRKRKHWSSKAGIGLAASLAGLLAMIHFAADPQESDTPVAIIQPDELEAQRTGEAPLVPPKVTVPEPSSTLLTLFGAVFLLGRRRR